MAALKHNAEIVDLLNDAMDVPFGEGTRRKQYVFRLEGLLKNSPNDYRVKLVLAKLHGEDGNLHRAAQLHDEVGLHVLSGDAVGLAAYLNLAVSRSDREKAVPALRTLYGMRNGSEPVTSQFAVYASAIGDADILLEMSTMQGEGAALSRNVLSVIEAGGLASIFSEHQKAVWNVLTGYFSIEYEVSVIGDPEVGTVDGVSFIYRFNLPFLERIALQKSLREKLGDLYQSRGIPRYAWVGNLSYVIGQVNQDSDQAA